MLDPHAAVASHRLCPWRSLFQFPLRSSVALFGLGGLWGMFGNPEKQVLFTVCNDSSVQKSTALCVGLHEHEKLIPKDVEENGRTII